MQPAIQTAIYNQDLTEETEEESQHTETEEEEVVDNFAEDDRMDLKRKLAYGPGGAYEMKEEV